MYIICKFFTSINFFNAVLIKFFFHLLYNFTVVIDSGKKPLDYHTKQRKNYQYQKQ